MSRFIPGAILFFALLGINILTTLAIQAGGDVQFHVGAATCGASVLGTVYGWIRPPRRI